MAEKKEEKKKKEGSQVKALDVVDMVQFMARPLKQLEEKFVSFVDQVEQQFRSLGGGDEVVRQKMQGMADELAKFDHRLNKADREAAKAQSMAHPVAGVEGDLSAMKPVLDRVEKRMSDLDSVLMDMRAADKSLVAHQRQLDGHKNDIVNVMAEMKSENRAVKDKLEDSGLDVKDVRRAMQSMSKEVMESDEAKQKQMNEFEARVNSRLEELVKLMDRLHVQAVGHTDEKMAALRLENDRLKDMFLDLASEQKQQLSCIGDFSEVLNLNKKNVELLERRMDHMATALKELRVEFGF